MDVNAEVHLVAPPIRRQHVPRELEHPVHLPDELFAPKGRHLHSLGQPSAQKAAKAICTYSG